MKFARILFAATLMASFASNQAISAQQRPHSDNVEQSAPRKEKGKSCRLVEQKAKDKSGRVVIKKTRVCK